MSSFKSARQLLVEQNHDNLGELNEAEKETIKKSHFVSARELLLTDTSSAENQYHQDENHNQRKMTEYYSSTAENPTKKNKPNEEAEKSTRVSLKGVGLQYCFGSMDDFKDFCDAVKTNSQVSFARDVGNEYDSLALAIGYEENQIGWIPFEVGKLLSPCIDNGTISLSDGHIISINERPPYHIQIEATMVSKEQIIDHLISELEKLENFKEIGKEKKKKIECVKVPRISYTLGEEEYKRARNIEENGVELGWNPVHILPRNWAHQDFNNPQETFGVWEALDGDVDRLTYRSLGWDPSLSSSSSPLSSPSSPLPSSSLSSSSLSLSSTSSQPPTPRPLTNGERQRVASAGWQAMTHDDEYRFVYESLGFPLPDDTGTVTYTLFPPTTLLSPPPPLLFYSPSYSALTTR